MISQIEDKVNSAANTNESASYCDNDLMKYLIETQGLSVAQAEKAFVINRRRTKQRGSGDCKPPWSLQSNSSQSLQRKDSFSNNPLTLIKVNEGKQSITKRKTVMPRTTFLARTISVDDLAVHRKRRPGRPSIQGKPIVASEAHKIVHQHVVIKEPERVAKKRYDFSAQKLRNTRKRDSRRRRFSKVNLLSLPPGTPQPKLVTTAVTKTAMFGGSSKRSKRRDSLANLHPSNREAGIKVINEFLLTELNYWEILQCLWDKYHVELTAMASRGEIQITDVEINKMFDHIPNLLRFHRTFYFDIKGGYNIAWMFVHLMHFFKLYINYVNGCRAMLKTMLRHAQDKKLLSSLKRIRLQSKRKKDDMVDLLLLPLDRINHYQEFLDKLYILADGGFYGKAARRMGRIARFINDHMVHIWERSEMNKVQQFLGKQYYVLSPHRKILRRGRMTRWATGWSESEGQYAFFLFNDLLLWTTTRGEFQDAVLLTWCSLMSSQATKGSKRKFQIIVNRHHNQTEELLLECKSKHQKKEWWNVITQAMDEVAVAAEEVLPMVEEEGEFVVEDSFEQEKTTSSSALIESSGSSSEDLSELYNYPVIDAKKEIVEQDSITESISQKYSGLSKSRSTSPMKRKAFLSMYLEEAKEVSEKSNYRSSSRSALSTVETSNRANHPRVRLGDGVSEAGEMALPSLNINLGDKDLLPQLEFTLCVPKRRV